MRRAIATGVIVMGSVMACAQSKPYWAYGLGSNGDDRATAVISSPDGAVYVYGTFSGAMSYPGGQVATQGVTDVFLARMDTMGTVEWIRTCGGPGPERATDIAADGSGNVTVTGQFSGTMSFGGTQLTSNGPSQDAFLARYSAAGDLLWSRSAGSTANADIGEHVAVDGSGNSYWAGEFSGTASFGALQASSTYDPGLQAPGIDVFLAKYSPTGDALWLKKGAARREDRVTGLAANANGHCWIAGQFSDTLTFDQTHTNTLTNVGFIVGFDGSGTEQWFRRVAGGGEVRMGELNWTGDTLWSVGGQAGNNLLFGDQVTAIASSYAHSAFVLGFTQQGQSLAQKTIGSDHAITATHVTARAGQLLVGGEYNCQPLELSERFGGDGLLLAWEPSNAWLALLRASDQYISYGQAVVDNSPMKLRGVALDEHERIYAVGEFNDLLVCPAIEGMVHVVGGDSLFSVAPDGLDGACQDSTYYDAITLRSLGERDAFLLKSFPRERKPIDILPRDENCLADLDLHFDATYMPGNTCDPITADVAFCGSGSLVAGFAYLQGPAPAYSWSNGASGPNTEVQVPGNYVVTATVPGCFTAKDSVSVDLCPKPWAPGITDSEGVNYQDSTTQTVQVCSPTGVYLTAGPLPGTSFHWLSPSNDEITDTVVYAGSSGLWVLEVFNAAGCSNSSLITVSVLPSDTVYTPTFTQAIEFPNDADGNDSLVICSNQSFLVSLIGIITNNGTPLLDNGSFHVTDSVLVSPGGYSDIGAFQLSQGSKSISMAYTTDGWYVFDFLLHIDDGPCHDHHASAMVRDSIYVSGLPSSAGQVDIVGSIFLCSGDTVHLTTLANLPGTFHWGSENGGIVGPDSLPSIDLVEPGLISVEFTPLDTSACVSKDYDDHSVQLVPSPSIVMSPIDGLICPGGSVQLTTAGVAGFYTWYGPGGVLPFTTSSISVQTPGNYFCVVSTFEGCEYATALQTVSIYSTPSLIVQPAAVLCEGGSVQVVVQPTQNADYAWSAPLSGNTAFQTITQPGTYGCSVTQCGVTTPLSFTVTLSTASVNIATPGPFSICAGDSVLLSATSGNVAYVWQPGDLVGQQVYAKVGGEYSVIGFNEHGCTDTAGTVVVNELGFSVPLSVQGDAVCAGHEATLTAAGSGTITWFADAALAQQVGSGASLSVPNITAGDTLYAVQTENGCTSAPLAALITLLNGGTLPHLTGDTLLCSGDTIAITVTPPDNVGIIWNAPFSGNAAVQNVTLPGTYSCGIVQCGDTTTIQLVVHPRVVEVVLLNAGPFELCAGDSVELQAAPGLSDYVWAPGEIPGPNLYVTQSGSYSVSAHDPTDCQGTSSEVVVTVSSITQPVVVDAPVVCAGQNANVHASGSGSFTWYAEATLSTPLGTGADLLIPSLNSSDTIYVVQQDGPCTSEANMVLLSVTEPPPAPNITGELALCSGDTLLLSIAPLHPAFWSTPTGTAGTAILFRYPVSLLDAGLYSAHYAIGDCEGPDASVNVTVTDPPSIDLGGDVILCPGGSQVLSVPPATFLQWSTGSSTPNITVSAPGIYWVRSGSAPDCADSDTLMVSIGECDVPVPNIVTPNGDGNNDLLTLTSPSFEPLSFEVFNRWGQTVFARSARIVEWDGRTGMSAQPVPDGTYFYIVRAVLPTGDPFERTGYIEVRR